MSQTKSSKRCVPTTALTKPCEQCGAEIRGMPSELARKRFCSSACVGKSRKLVRKKTWVKIRCQECGVEFEVTPAWARNGRRKYCSKECHTKAGIAQIAQARLGVRHTDATRRKISEAVREKQLREKSSQWKGGRYTDSQGYAHTYIPDLPEADQVLARQMTRAKYVLEHRVVMARKLGRPLHRDETVHHRNGIKLDNAPENLILASRKDHSSLHREVEAELRRLREENLALRSLLGLSPQDGIPTSRS